jgi:hypothetical protein
MSGTLYIWAKKLGDGSRRYIKPGGAPPLYDSTSIVIPCHNEMNIQPLVNSIVEFYGPYVYEIVIVNMAAATALPKWRQGSPPGIRA